MIDIKSLSAEWLAEKRNIYNQDPNIMESMIHALYLLEQLKITGLDFIFKGGTSLILLMEQPKRFSVDIDIIIDPNLPKEELEIYLSKIVDASTFERMVLDRKRSYKEGIPKAHYKFIYKSNFPNRNKEGDVISNPERDILLDILFTENLYPVLVNRPIETEWLIQNGDPVIITTPDIDSIAGDKLTAFAPNTTGVPYGVEKEKEIIKQLFDVACLFELLNDVEVFKKSFIESANCEIKYRPERNVTSFEQVLHDTINTALLIARKDILIDEEDKAKFNEINIGINQFGHFVYVGKFGVLEAQVAGAKAAYLAAIILTDNNDKIQTFSPAISLTDYMITNLDYNYLNKRLKFVAQGEALFYWHQTISLLFPGNKK
ncbi:MAG: nucleotidyl transferase AbiEii/AbiGii toxin family protein [Bacteroidales bacterium]|nr:nucleotidyl transferase AbiEii/AbiGii toxin family protein [Bacteroidales bacterium]